MTLSGTMLRVRWMPGLDKNMDTWAYQHMGDSQPVSAHQGHTYLAHRGRPMLQAFCPESAQGHVSLNVALPAHPG